MRGARTSGDGGLHGARADAGQAGWSSEVSAVMCWIVWCEGGCNGDHPVARRWDRVAQGRTQRTSVGGALRGAMQRGVGIVRHDGGRRGDLPGALRWRKSLILKYL